MTQMNICTGILLFIMLFPILLVAQKSESNRYYYLLIGTYTSGKSEGIYLYRFDSKTGEATHQYTAKEIDNPSYLKVSPQSEYVFAVNELNDAGKVSAYRFNRSAGTLDFINQQPSNGGAPCYLTTSENGDHLFVGNYSGGNLSVYNIQEDGSLGPPIQTIQHEGSSANKQRQEKAHVHSTVFTPEGKYLFVGDLGTDKIFSYCYNPKDKNKPLEPAEVPYTEVKPGSGPRHIIFDKAGKFAYVVLELTSDVAVFSHKKGQLTHLQTVQMEAEGFRGDVSGAEIRISPDGKFLYASNRGDANEIVIFSIDQANGTLTFVDRQSSLGKTPRNFFIDPSGNYLLVANQNSDSIVIFKRNSKTGKITPTGQTLELGNPVYLTMTGVD